jgi:hypothetical protein
LEPTDALTFVRTVLRPSAFGRFVQSRIGTFSA